MVSRLSLAQPTWGHRLKLFLALSRTPHGLLDLATPGLAALLCLGRFPGVAITLLGLITVFAGYTAIYALNDLVDYRTDKAKIGAGGLKGEGYLDGVLVRHPMAQGLLSFKEGFLWAMLWAAVALVGAYLLNPICALIFVAGAFMETVYCLMLEMSHLRTLVSGVVKTLGGVAAVFAVNPKPSPVFLTLLFLWIFFWEIGGQNVPADWHDLEEDQRWHAKTVPVRYGAEGSGRIILGSLIISVALLLPLQGASPAQFSWFLRFLSLGAGVVLLIIPALRLYQTEERSRATVLFNYASYYPLAIFLLTVLALLG
jgi:4-hydroxybenzoate polyprenyltransferase